MRRRVPVFGTVIVSLLLMLGFNDCQSGKGAGGSSPQPSRGTEAGNPMAALPQIFLNSSYPSLLPGHGVLTVGNKAGDTYSDCQAAVDAAKPGDEIIIDAGFVCGPVTLKDKGSSTSPIVIRSSNLNLLPPQGTRVSHNDAPNMAVIETENDSYAVGTDPAGAPHHYFLSGLEIRLGASVSVENFMLVNLGTGLETSLSQLPHDIVIDRCWIHAGPQQEEKRGVQLNAAAVSIVDSVIDDIHLHNQESQAVAGWNNGVGPFKIVDDELVAAGENVIFGSAPTTIQGLIPSDIEFRKNWVHKPASWQTQQVTSLSGTTGLWSVVDLMELANAQRVLIDGNIFEYSWVVPGHWGFGLELIPVSEGNGAVGSGQPWVRVQDVTVSNNIVRHAAGGFNILYQDPNDTLAVAQRLDFENNLVYDVGPQWGAGKGLIQLVADAQGPTRFNHNTLLDVAGGGPDIISAAGQFPQFFFTNNLANNEGTGIQGNSLADGAATLKGEFPMVAFYGNALAGQNGNSYSGYTLGNFFPADLSAVGFVTDPTSGVSDYHTLALAPGSPFKNAASDGKDVGADLGALDGAMR